MRLPPELELDYPRVETANLGLDTLGIWWFEEGVDEPAAYAHIIFEREWWTFVALEVYSGARQGFLTKLALAVGRNAPPEAELFIPEAAESAGDAFEKIGFVRHKDGTLTSTQARTLEYGEWKLEEGAKPSFRK